MSPLSAPVLGTAALVSSPAFWAAFVDGTTTTETALLRFAVCVVLAWGALAAVMMLIGPAPRPAQAPEVAATVDAGARE